MYRVRWILVLLPWIVAGCAVVHPPVDSVMKGKHRTAGEDPKVTVAYTVACPDVLELTIAGHGELSGLQPIGVDGRISLGALGRLRVDGESVQEVNQDIAKVTGTPPAEIQVKVADYRSQEVFVFGQVAGAQRAVAYRGPETVHALLERIGGITPGASPCDVYVVRSRIPEGHRPEVFHVDLRAIVIDHDLQTDVRLAPFDQIYVGQNRRSTVEKCVPPCLQPVYELFCGLYRP